MAVSNYRQGKKEVEFKLRKVTGWNKVQDQWAGAGKNISDLSIAGMHIHLTDISTLVQGVRSGLACRWVPRW